MKFRNIINIIILILLYLLFFSFPVFAWEGASFSSTLFPASLSARTAAMGGLHCTLADDMNVFFSNPAGFRAAGTQFSAAELSLSFYGDAPQILADTITGMDTTTTDPDFASFNLVGPISLGYIGDGLGLLIFNTFDVSLWIEESPVPYTFNMNEANLVLIAGGAFPVPLPDYWNSTLDFGLSLVPFIAYRGTSYEIEAFQSDPNYFISMIDIPTQYEVQTLNGTGLEFGLLYSFKDILSVGLVSRNLAMLKRTYYSSFQDFLNKTEWKSFDTFIPPDVSVGVSWSPRLDSKFMNLRFMLDYRNILDFVIYPDRSNPPLLHISAGIEMQLLEILYLRAGMYQLLPSVGLGLDLHLFKLDLAFFGREASHEIYGDPIYKFMIGITL